MILVVDSPALPYQHPATDCACAVVAGNFEAKGVAQPFRCRCDESRRRTVMSEKCVMCNCKRTINVQICLSSDRDVALLKDLLTLLEKHDKRNKPTVSTTSVVSPDSTPQQANRSCSSTADHDANNGIENERAHHDQDRYNKLQAQPSAQSEMPLDPSDFLNESELALLTTTTPNGKKPQRFAYRKISISDSWREPTSLPQDGGHYSSKLSPSSDFWLKNSSSHSIQEWLARKERECQKQKKQARIAKTLVEEETQQSCLSTLEQQQRARASYQQWLRKKSGTLSVSPGAKASDELEEASVITVGSLQPQSVKSPKSPQHRIKRSITFEEWAATKKSSKSNAPKPSPILNQANEGKEKLHSFRKNITYESWLKSKGEVSHMKSRSPVKTAKR